MGAGEHRLARISHRMGPIGNSVFGGADIPVCPVCRHFDGRQECLPHRGEKCGLVGRTIDSEEPASEIVVRKDCGMNSLSQPNYIGVHRARDDARMAGLGSMQADKVPTVKRRRRATVRRSERQDFFVGPRPVGFSGLLNGKHIVAKRRSSTTTGSGKFSLA